MQVLGTIVIVIVTATSIRLLFRKVLDLPAYNGKLFTENAPVENLMPEDQFWKIIKTTIRNSNRNYTLQCELLTAYLTELSQAEIIRFDRTLTFLLQKACQFRLWEPAYALNGGCSDDGFYYFRSWLVAQGKNKFYWTIKYPRLLFLVGVKELIEQYEGLSYCTYEAYQQKTGTTPEVYTDIMAEDPGQIFKEGEAFLRYPELALLAW